MESVLCSSLNAAETPDVPAAEAAQQAAAAKASKRAQKRYSAKDFLVLCDDFRTARMPLDAEVFSAFGMVFLLLDEIEGFLSRRCGSLQDAAALLRARGLEITENTLRFYLGKARRLKASAKGEACAKLREAIFAEAEKEGRSLGAGKASSEAVVRKACQPSPSDSREEAPVLPAEDRGEWSPLDGDWLNSAVSQAMEQPEPAAKADAPSPAKRDKKAKKRARRRLRRR